MSQSLQSPRDGEFQQPLAAAHTKQRRTSVLITNIQVIVALFQILLILFNAYVAYDLTLKISMLYVTVLHFLHIIRVGIYNKRLYKGIDCCGRVLWGLLATVYYGFVIYYLDNPDFNIQYPCFILVGFTLLWFLHAIQQYYKVKNEETFIQLGMLIIKTVLGAQLVLVNLQLVQWIQWSWFYVFTVLWVLLAVFAVLQVCFIMDLVYKSSTLLSEHDPDNRDYIYLQIIGSLWINLTLLSITAVPTITIIGLCIKLQLQEQTFNSINITLSVIYSLVYVVYTLYYKQILVEFLNSLLDDTQRMNPNQSQQQPQPNSPNSRFKSNLFSDVEMQPITNKRELLAKLPTVLMRLSSTYFLPDDLNNVDTRRHRTESKQQKDKIKQSMTELEQEKEFQCFNCCQADSQTVNMPCGHGGLCVKCAMEWFKEKQECLICRKPVEQIVQVQQDDENRVKVVDIIAVQS